MLLSSSVLFCLVELVRGAPIVRRVWHEILLAITRLDLAAGALLRWLVPPRYELQGACQRRGACCTQIVAHPPRLLWRRPWLLRTFVRFHRWAHNFHQVGEGPNHEIIFRCHYLTPGGRCGIYRFRPRLCRTYPLLPFFAPPKLLPGCGYRVKRRGLEQSPRLPIVSPHVGVHHPTPPKRVGELALEYAEDFRLVEPGAEAALAAVSLRETATGSRCR